MEKSFCIKPANEEMQIVVQAVHLLNEFKKKFDVRRSFMEVMSEKLPKYNSREGYDRLSAFWSGRVRSQEVNDDVEKVLELLKAE